jgi:hypothetical protein
MIGIGTPRSQSKTPRPKFMTFSCVSFVPAKGANDINVNVGNPTYCDRVYQSQFLVS